MAKGNLFLMGKAFLLLGVLLSLQTRAATITTIQPTQGSVNGQTRLTILGTGFDERGRSNDVYIGDSIYGVFCDPIPNECHPERIVCLTDAHDAVGPMKLTVRSQGFLADCLISTGCTFEYTVAKTPLVQSISPQWIEAPDTITFTGERFTQGDVSVGNFDFTTHLGAEERCVLPDGQQVASTSFSCNVLSMRPGALPVDVILGASGRASWGTPAVVYLFPTLNAVEPSNGSLAGGQRVTLTGTSFSPIPSDNVVTIAGSPCVVDTATTNTLECVTTAHAATSVPQPTWTPGKVRVNYWEGLPGATIGPDWIAKAEYLFPTDSKVVSTFGKANNDPTLWVCDYCAFEFTTWFVPKADGTHTFSLIGDDSWELWLGTDDTPVKRKQQIYSATVLDVTPYNDRRICFGSGSPAMSKNVTLSAGTKYWMRVYLKENAGSDYFTLKIQLPDGTTLTNPTGDWLALRDDWTPSVALSVKGFDARLGEPCYGWGNCQFDYLDQITPRVNSVTASAAPGSTIVISGSGFDTTGKKSSGTGSCTLPDLGCGGGGCNCPQMVLCNLFDDLCQWDNLNGVCNYKNPPQCNTWSLNAVTVDGVDCPVTAQTATELQCTLPFVSGGLQLVQVNNAASGNALGQIFVNVQSSIRKISPSSGSIKGGNTVFVEGKAFDPYPGVSSLTIGGNACNVTAANPFEFQCTVPAGAANTTNVVLSSKTHFKAILPFGYSYDEQFQRPGTDFEDPTISVFPTVGSVIGGTIVSVKLPSSLMIAKLSQISASFGSYRCTPSFVLGNAFRCVTSAGVRGTYQGQVNITDSTGTVKTFTLPRFTYRAGVAWIDVDTISPFGGSQITIQLDSSIPAQKELTVSVEGQRCTSLWSSRQYVYCLTPPQPSPFNVPLTTVDSFNFNGDGSAYTNKLYRMDYTAAVRALADGTVLIPTGSNYLMTKESYARPFVFRAKIKPLKDLADGARNVAIRALVQQNSLEYSGYSGIAGYDAAGRFAFNRNGWLRSPTDVQFKVNTPFASIGIDSSRFVEYKMEVWERWVKFYIDGVLVYTDNDRLAESGTVGVGFCDVDVIVDDFVIESLYPRALQINISGVPVWNTYDSIYDGSRVPKITSIKPTSVKMGDTITVSGTNLWGYSNLRIAAQLDPNDSPSSPAGWICSQGNMASDPITGATTMRCVVSSIPAGTYYPRVMNQYGAGDTYDTAITVGVAVTAVSPVRALSTGNRITVSGGGFSGDAAVTVGGSDCPIEDYTSTEIVCRSPALADGSQAVSVASASKTATCTACKVQYGGGAGPVVTAVSPSSGPRGTEITVTGSSFPGSAFVRVGLQNCNIRSATATEIRCAVDNFGTGTFSVVVGNENGTSTVTSGASFAVTAGLTWLDRSSGPTNGGTRALAYGTVDTANSVNNVASYTFSSSVEQGWTGADPSISRCGGDVFFGRHREYVTLSKTFTGLPSHSYIRISFSFLTTGPHLRLNVDGQLRFTQDSFYVTQPARCDGNWVYIADNSVIIPHSDSTLKLDIATDSYGGFWGLKSYGIDTLTSLPQSVKVNGNAATVSIVTANFIEFRTPSGSGDALPVRVNIGGTETCSTCSWKYDSTLDLSATIAVPGWVQGFNSASGAIPELAVSSDAQATYGSNGVTVTRRTNNGWNCDFFTPRPISKADGVGVQAGAPNFNGHAMIGLTSNFKQGSSYDAIEFAIYLNAGGGVEIYEFGSGLGGVASWDGSDVFAVQYDDSCGCIRYSKNGLVIYSSNRKVQWPLRVEGNIYSAGMSLRNIRYLSPLTPANRLVVAGSGITAGQGTASINGADCDASYVTAGHISCWTTTALTVGTSVSVGFSTLLGSVAATSLTIKAAVVIPTGLVSSRSGGLSVPIVGGPFSGASVSIDNSIGSLTLTNQATRSITASTPAVSSDTSGKFVFTQAGDFGCISNIDVAASSTSLDCPTIQFTAAATPTVTSITPTTATLGSSITFQGTFFVDPSVTVTIGTGQCTGAVATTTSVICTVTNVPAGTWTPSIQFSTKGLAVNTATLTVPLSISSLSTVAVGSLGGAVLTINGNGFGSGTSGATIVVGSTTLCSSYTLRHTAIDCTVVAGTFSGVVTVTIGTLSATSTDTLTAAASSNPTVTSINGATGGIGALVTIAGTNLGVGRAVIGTATCVHVSSSATSFSCLVNSSLSAGTYSVQVYVQDRGLASGSLSFTAGLVIQSVFPIRGPKTGGQTVTITGSALANVSAVAVGGSNCRILSTSDSVVTCVTGAMIDAADHSVAVHSVLGPVSTLTSPVQYTYDTSLTATITAVSPTAGSAAGLQLITISGTNFNTEALKNQVQLGSTRCDVQSATSTQIICRTTPSTPGSVQILINIANQGIASGSVSYQYQLQIDSVSPAGPFSVEGGATVTFTGAGFVGFTASDFLYQKFFLSVGWNPCAITTATATTLVCTLGASPRPIVDMATLQGSYNMPPDFDASVSLVANGITATVASTVSIRFRQSATPTITSVSPTGIVTSGATVTIGGTSFAASGNLVTINNATCTVTSESTTQIVCTLTNGNPGASFVYVTVPGIGRASTTTTCPDGQYLLCDGSCIADADCRYDDWGMTNCADLMHLIVHDTFCHSNGGTDRVNKPLKTDSGRVFAVNCPLYSCEGRDCNTTLYIGGTGGRVSTCGADPNGKVIDFRSRITATANKESSMGGGQRVTMTGTRFGSSVSAVSAYIGTAMCTAVSVSDTQIVCETTANDAATDLKLRVWVMGVEAQCDDCSGFSFADAKTPTLTAVAPSNPIAGQSITLTGTKFSTVATENIVSIGGSGCTVTAATATQIVCTAPYLSAGAKNVFLRVVGFGSPVNTVKATYVLRVDSISKSQGSTAGGLSLTVQATGITRSSTVIFGSSSCVGTPVSYTPGTAVVLTPACSGNQAVLIIESGATSINCGSACTFSFASSATPSISQGQVSGNSISLTVAGFGSTFSVAVGDNACSVTSSSSTSVSCTVGSSHPAGTFLVQATVADLGYAVQPSTPVTFTYGLTVGTVAPASGSRGGNQAVTIQGTGFSSVPSQNSVSIGGVNCNVTSATATQLICMTGATATEVTATPTVTVKHPKNQGAYPSASSSTSYSFLNSLTPVVGSVLPNRGSTAGGTSLTITGSGFSASLTITIDGVNCTQSASQLAASTSSVLYCTTGAHATMFDPVLIRVTDATNGDAYNTNGKYQFIDLWSRWTTWGNNPPPTFGDSAVLSEGQVVMVDYSPPRFHLIIVMGHLIWDDTADILFECTYIMVNFGQLTIGTEARPYTKKATIRLWGDRLTPEIPVHGSKVIALRHGTIDMYGIKRQPTWTLLAATVPPGSSTITVRGPVDWKAGEFIGIGSTDYFPESNELRQIVSVSPSNGQADNVTLELEWPLEYQHFGERQCFGDNNEVCVDEIAEVTLLTRNIVIEGDRNTPNLGFGGTMFLMPMGEGMDRYARIAYVEFRNVGQQFIVGRYPVHFHVTGSANTSYCIGNSVHQSLNRAFSIHGVNNNTYKDNVVFDTAGHSFFIEDGSERWNVIENNVVMMSRVSTSNLNTDLTPASFWIVSPLNRVVGNRAAGSEAYGFWISPFDPTSTGPTYSPYICPYTQRLWEFKDNVAHSNHKYGVNIFRFWFPKAVECDMGSADVPAYLRNIVTYKNQIHGVTCGNQEVGRIGSVIFDNLTSADNGWIHPDASAYWTEKNTATNMTVGLQNSALIALTNNMPFRRSLHRRGVNLPLGDNFFTYNVTFVNYNGENHGPKPGPSACLSASHGVGRLRAEASNGSTPTIVSASVSIIMEI